MHKYIIIHYINSIYINITTYSIETSTSMIGEKWAAGAMVGAGGCGDSGSGVGRSEGGSTVSHP